MRHFRFQQSHPLPNLLENEVRIEKTRCCSEFHVIPINFAVITCGVATYIISMNKKITILMMALLLTGSLSGCLGNGNKGDDDETDTVPVGEPGLYEVLKYENITFASGLAHTDSSTEPSAVPLMLDVYCPDSNSTDRSVLMFIHGGGFKGGTKNHAPIMEMGNYYASRGWVFVSIEYRTLEEMGDIDGKTHEEIVEYYRGISPQAWVESVIDTAESEEEIQTGVAMYAAQRDAKAALRWVVANAAVYNISTDNIAVGGASAGAVTTVALGVSELGDFRDEISLTDDPTLSTTNLNETYDIKSMVYFWGSNIKLELFEMSYGLNRYDSDDPDLFMAHGTNDRNPNTPYSEAIELQGIYDDIGVHNELVTLEGAYHAAWDAVVDGKGLFELSFDFLMERQLVRSSVDPTPDPDSNQSNSEYRKLVTSEGEERKFIVTVPDSVNESHSVPVVIVLHGTSSTGQIFHDKPDLWVPKAEQEGFIVVHPTALVHCHIENGIEKTVTKWSFGDLGQNDTEMGGLPLCEGQTLANDLEFFDMMVDILKTEYPVDEKRIYVTGNSNGAGMGLRLAAERSDVFAAVAINAGAQSLFIEKPEGSRPISILYTVGAKDHLLAEMGFSIPLVINESLINELSPLIQPLLTLHSLGNASDYIYTETTYQSRLNGQYLFENNSNGNSLRFTVIEGLGHPYSTDLVPAFWDYFETHSLD